MIRPSRRSAARDAGGTAGRRTGGAARAARRIRRDPMLRSTFIHLGGIGPSREKALWARGVRSWDELRRAAEVGESGEVREDVRRIAAGVWKAAAGARRDGALKIPNARRERLLEELRASEAALDAGDAAFFADRLPMRERYRLARDFEGRICFLDVETDSVAAGRPPAVTVAGIYDGASARVFVRGADLDDLPEVLAAYPVLCTFNGASFDIPCLEAEFGRGFYGGAHIDLRPVLAAAGLRGGLKAVEERVGILRPPAVRGLNGFDAVGLWHEASAGSEAALKLLARYNLADTVALNALLRLACNLRISADGLPFRRFDRMDDPAAEAAVEDAVRAMPRT